MTQLSFKQTLGALSFIRMSGVMRRCSYSLEAKPVRPLRYSPVPSSPKRGSK